MHNYYLIRIVGVLRLVASVSLSAYLPCVVIGFISTTLSLSTIDLNGICKVLNDVKL